MVKKLRLKDPGSALTHLVGALLSVAGLVALIRVALVRGSIWHVVSFSVFGASLILLYTASTLYHWLSLPPKATLALRKVDHIMIFLLIAGSYTPFTLVALRGVWGWSLFSIVWSLALFGAIVKLFWMSAPRWLYTLFYLLMGWMVVVAAYPLVKALTLPSLIWLAAGGLSYTVGAIFYATKWPNPWPGKFGFHEIWHLFVMGGSLAHFAAVMTLR